MPRKEIQNYVTLYNNLYQENVSQPSLLQGNKQIMLNSDRQQHFTMLTIGFKLHRCGLCSQWNNQELKLFST